MSGPAPDGMLPPHCIVFIDAFIGFVASEKTGLQPLLDTVAAQVGVMALALDEEKRDDFLRFAAQYIFDHALDRVALQKETLQ